MDLLLEADDLLAHLYLVETLEYTFTAHHHAVCAWANRNKVDYKADPTARINMRPGLMAIVNG